MGYRDQVSDSEFLEDVVAEVERAESLHPGMNSLHEAYAVILEEFNEFWDEVKKNPKRRDRLALRTELMQTAAMCVRTARDCGLENR